MRSSEGSGVVEKRKRLKLNITKNAKESFKELIMVIVPGQRVGGF